MARPLAAGRLGVAVDEWRAAKARKDENEALANGKRHELVTKQKYVQSLEFRIVALKNVQELERKRKLAADAAEAAKKKLAEHTQLEQEAQQAIAEAQQKGTPRKRGRGQGCRAGSPAARDTDSGIRMAEAGANEKKPEAGAGDVEEKPTNEDTEAQVAGTGVDPPATPSGGETCDHSDENADEHGLIFQEEERRA